MTTFSVSKSYKNYVLKDLNGKSGYFVYGEEQGYELLVFIEHSTGNSYLVAELSKEEGDK